MFVVRYRPGVPLNQRKHEFTSSHRTWLAADEALERVPAEVRDLLEIQGPRCPNRINVDDRIVFQRGRPIHVGCASGADDQ